jgi:hypothetical protein
MHKELKPLASAVTNLDTYLFSLQVHSLLLHLLLPLVTPVARSVLVRYYGLGYLSPKVWICLLPIPILDPLDLVFALLLT